MIADIQNLEVGQTVRVETEGGTIDPAIIGEGDVTEMPKDKTIQHRVNVDIGDHGIQLTQNRPESDITGWWHNPGDPDLAWLNAGAVSELEVVKKGR